jgi:hypothetical protein
MDEIERGAVVKIELVAMRPPGCRCDSNRAITRA